jgi:hypothetical protein
MNFKDLLTPPNVGKLLRTTLSGVLDNPPFTTASPPQIFEYTTTTEYRVVFRQITNSTIDIPENPYDIDDETLDETDYDETAVSAFLDHIYNKTKHNPLFCALYDLAAAKMISEDREIGLTILLSYDYLWAFYSCVCEFTDHPNTFSESNEWYIRLRNTLS